MSLFFVDSGWDKVLDDALCKDRSSIKIVCPFIKKGAARRLLHHGKPDSIRVITRANLNDFYSGVSDTAALRLLLESGAEIRGVKGLHAKLYLFGESTVILTSANLTEAALRKNHEFGLIASDKHTLDQCLQYFDAFWKKAGDNIPVARLDEWDKKIEKHLAGKNPNATAVGLGDEGVYVENFAEPASLPLSTIEVMQNQAFVKFFGEGDDRAPRAMSVFEEIKGSGSHWACTYPKGKRPRSVKDGAVMFMGRLVTPPDVIIYGKAVARAHRPGIDDAGEEDFRERSWKQDWPHYIRVTNPEFVAGSLFNGVSLNELMDALGSKAFASTKRNKATGTGNTDPRKALMQQPAVELSPEGLAWVSESLSRAFLQHGKLPVDDLAKLDWPGAQGKK